MTGGGGIWVVDRIEGDTYVLVEDESGRILELGRGLLSVSVDEGTVLRVPVSEDGELGWGVAVVDEELRRRRIEDASGILEELKKRDPGGDVVL